MTGHRSEGKGGRARRDWPIYTLALLSVTAFALVRSLADVPSRQLAGRMRQAAEIMDKARLAILACRRDQGLSLNTKVDINGTGLIGLEYSSLTTSLGILEAKRTTANPDMAALIVRLLDEAAVKRGDAVAIGASSSFPALVLASWSACQALELKPVLICSLGASQYGANDPAFTWLDIMDCLKEAGIMDVRPAAVSLGGESDSGRNMNPAGRALLLREVHSRGLSLLEEPDLARNVSARMKLYGLAAGPAGVKVFINIGGSWANMGTDSRVLEVKPGLARLQDLPPPGRRGVLYEMAGRGIPVIHLLYIRGLAKKYGLPWDPLPLPRPGSSALFRQVSRKSPLLAVIGFAYFLLVFLALLIMKRGQYSGAAGLIWPSR